MINMEYMYIYTYMYISCPLIACCCRNDREYDIPSCTVIQDTVPRHWLKPCTSSLLHSLVLYPTSTVALSAHFLFSPCLMSLIWCLWSEVCDLMFLIWRSALRYCFCSPVQNSSAQYFATFCRLITMSEKLTTSFR